MPLSYIPGAKENQMKERSLATYMLGLLFPVFGLIIVNSFQYWRPFTGGVVLDSWQDILWAVNLSLAVHLAGYAILIWTRADRFFSLIRAIQTAAGLLSTIVFLQVFPLDFTAWLGSWMNMLFKGLLILGILGSCIGVIVQSVRFVTELLHTPGNPQANTSG
jgi:hypothetical protein